MMGLFSFSKKDEDMFATDEQMIVFDNEAGLCDIYDNVTVTATEVIKESVIKVAIADCKVFNGSYGRIYVVNARDHEYIENGQRLAQLEMTQVFKQLTHFKPEEKVNPNKDMKFWALFLVAFALVVAVMVVG